MTSIDEIKETFIGKRIKNVYIEQSVGWMEIEFDDDTFITIDIDTSSDPPTVDFSFHQSIPLIRGERSQLDRNQTLEV